MGILQQLEKVHINKEEIEAISAFTSQIERTYERNLSEFDTIIESGQIPAELALKLKEAKEEFIIENQSKLNALRSFKEKINLVKEIFNEK